MLKGWSLQTNRLSLIAVAIQEPSQHMIWAVSGPHMGPIWAVSGKKIGVPYGKCPRAPHGAQIFFPDTAQMGPRWAPNFARWAGSGEKCGQNVEKIWAECGKTHLAKSGTHLGKISGPHLEPADISHMGPRYFSQIQPRYSPYGAHMGPRYSPYGTHMGPIWGPDTAQILCQLGMFI